MSFLKKPGNSLLRATGSSGSSLAKASVQFTPPATTNVDVHKFAEVLSRSLDDLPVSKYAGISTQLGALQEDLTDWYLYRATDYRANGALLVESHDHSVVALWLPPGFKKEAKSGELDDLPPRFINVFKALHSANARHGFDVKPHWHLQYLGRDPCKESIKGAISSVMAPILLHSKQRKVPVVLESAGAKATQVYEHYGFKALETISIEGEEMFELMVYE